MPEAQQKSEEENILKTIIEKESWEDVIYYIVSLEQLNPWDVNLVKLTGSFIKFIKNAGDLDFRIPAKIVFIAAVLLRLKADYLSIFEEEETIEEAAKQQQFGDRATGGATLSAASWRRRGDQRARSRRADLAGLSSRTTRASCHAHTGAGVDGLLAKFDGAAAE